MRRLPRPVPDRLHNEECPYARHCSHDYDHIQLAIARRIAILRAGDLPNCPQRRYHVAYGNPGGRPLNGPGTQKQQNANHADTVSRTANVGKARLLG